MKPKPSRKLSVHISRQFSYEAFGLETPIKDASIAKRKDAPRLIENGQDLTPFDLIEKDYNSDCSEECDDALTWIPRIMEGIVTEGKIDSYSQPPALASFILVYVYQHVPFSRPVLQQHSTNHRVQDDISLYEEDTCAAIEKRHSDIEEEAVESQSFPAESLNKSTTESDVEVLEKEVQSESYDNISTGTNTKNIGYKESGSMYSLMESKIPGQDERATQKIEEIVEAIMIQKGTLLDSSEGQISHPQCDIKKGLPELDVDEYNAFESIQLRQMRQALFQSKSTLEKLTQLERAVQQNNFRRQQIEYRNLPLAPFTIGNRRKNAGKSSSLKHLFHFQCPASENRIITSMAWHNTSTDVLAVGYAGDREHFDQGGLVMFWSLRNPSFPEKRIKASSAVTTIAFSSLSPTILAVGMDDGCISLYDTSYEICSTVFINTGTTLGRHMATVTQLQWVVDKQQNKTERLLSTSIDGRVLIWSLKQGMSLQPLMTLKRQDGKENELPNIPMIICMDSPKVGNSEFYVTGCEDGTLFVCSRSYTEKHLAEIKGHMSTVTSVKFSPFEEKLFITSSADSTIKLWRYDSKQSSVESVLTIHPALWAPVNDVVWSPKEPSVFAFVTGDGRIQVWDYDKGKLDPIISITVDSSETKETELTKIMFGKNASTLVVADEQGTVGVYRVF